MMTAAGEKRSAPPDAVEAKRSRVSLACVGCRRKKERCDGSQPICGPCRNQNRHCCYAPRPKKRGLPAGYVRALEILLGLMFHSVDGCQDSALALLRGKIKVTPTDVDESNSIITYFAETWRKSSVAKELEVMLTSMDVEEEDVITARDLHDRLETIMTEALAFGRNECHESTNTQTLDPSLSSAAETISSPELPTRTEPPFPETSIQQVIPPIEYTPPTGIIPHDWLRLVDMYYITTHCWFPMVPKHDTLRVAYSLAANPSSSSNDLIPGDSALLWAILAYASHQNCMVPNLDQREDERKSRAHKDLLQQASILAMDQGVTHDIGHVQALLILTLLYVGQGLLSKAWVLVGRAIYLVVDMTATTIQHDATPQAPLDTKTHRAYLGCFVLETIIASRMGRRPYFRRGEIERVGLLQVDGIEEWEVWSRPAWMENSLIQAQAHHAPVPARCLSTFNKWVRLVYTLNDYCHLRHSDPDGHNLERMIQDLVPPDHYLASSPTLTNTASATPHLLNLNIAYASICTNLWKKQATWSATAATAATANVSAGRNWCLRLQEQAAPVVKQVVSAGFASMLPLMDVYLHPMGEETTEPRQLQQTDSSIESETHTIFQSLRNECHRFWRKSCSNTTPSGGILPTYPTDARNSSIQMRLDHSSGSHNPQLEPSLPSHVSHGVSYGMIGTNTNIYPAHGAAVESPGNDLYSTLASLDTASWPGGNHEFFQNLGIPRDTVPGVCEDMFGVWEG